MRRAAAAWVALLAIAAGCAGRAGPPEIIDGTPCATCGMGVSNRRFACERFVVKAWRVYDSIECLLEDTGPPGSAVYLADYDTQTLHSADSLWVVRGEFSTPMGGGLAAFLKRAAADTVAARTRGRVGRLAEFAEEEAAGGPADEGAGGPADEGAGSVRPGPGGAR